MNEKTNIREWYTHAFTWDVLGLSINPAATFEDLFTCLDTYGDVYELLDVGDSCVRERCFQALADIMDVSYECVYDQWLLAA